MTMVWEAETTVIRLIAVVIVFALLHGRGSRPGRWTALNILAAVACAVAHFVRGGPADLASALGGMAVAAALTVPLALRGSDGGRVSAASIAAGSVLGPAGAAAALGMAVALAMLARMAGSGGAFIPDRFEPALAEAEPASGRSLLMMMERGRPLAGGPGADGSRGGPDSAPATGPIPPRIILAAATLAALMTEAFV